MSQLLQSTPQLNAATLKVRDIIVHRANRLEKDISNRQKSIETIGHHLSENTVSQDLRIKFAPFQFPKSISEEDKQRFIEQDEELNRKFQRDKMELCLGLLNHSRNKLEDELNALTLNGTTYGPTIQSLLPSDMSTSTFDLTLLRKSVLDVITANKIQKHQQQLKAPAPATQPPRAMAIEEDRMAALEKQLKELQISLNRFQSKGIQPTPGLQHNKNRPIQDTFQREHNRRTEDWRRKSASPRRREFSASRSSPHRPQSPSRGREKIRGREKQEKENQRPQQNRRGRSNESRHRF
jgi:hypothetical protein